jgi:Phosphate transport regulator (distant homolog of PhoU)
MKVSEILQVLIPKDGKFFPLFESSADNMVEASKQLHSLVTATTEDDRQCFFSVIRKLEKEGDAITGTIVTELNKTFITPFDREEIHDLAISMDDVTDSIYGVSQKIKLYIPKTHSEQLPLMSEALIKTTQTVKEAVGLLRNARKNTVALDGYCFKIHDFENQADDLYYSSMMQLFQNEDDAIELIKKKEILTDIERAFDKAKDVSNVLRSILIKLA